MLPVAKGVAVVVVVVVVAVVVGASVPRAVEGLTDVPAEP